MTVKGNDLIFNNKSDIFVIYIIWLTVALSALRMIVYHTKILV